MLTPTSYLNLIELITNEAIVKKFATLYNHTFGTDQSHNFYIPYDSCTVNLNKFLATTKFLTTGIVIQNIPIWFEIKKIKTKTSILVAEVTLKKVQIIRSELGINFICVTYQWGEG